MNFFEYIQQYQAQLLARTMEHIGLVGVSMLVAALIGIPAGIWMTRRPLVERWVLGIANTAQTIPSLALFGLLIPLPLIGELGPGQRSWRWCFMPCCRSFATPTPESRVSTEPCVRPL